MEKYWAEKLKIRSLWTQYCSFLFFLMMASFLDLFCDLCYVTWFLFVARLWICIEPNHSCSIWWIKTIKEFKSWKNERRFKKFNYLYFKFHICYLISYIIVVTEMLLFYSMIVFVAWPCNKWTFWESITISREIEEKRRLFCFANNDIFCIIIICSLFSL